MEQVLETPRLILRRWRDADRKPFAAMNEDPEVMRFLPKPLTAAESDAFVDRIERQFGERGYGLWAVELKEGGNFLGFIGLNYTDFPADFTPCVEIGWRLARAFWGNGFAAEGARTCLKFAFSELRLPAIHSFTSVLNVQSVRVMQKIGLRKIKEFQHPKLEPSHPLNAHVLYALTREEFRNNGGGAV